MHFARELSVPSHPEGVVAGDELGLICMSEEDGGLWRFDAKPDADPAGYLVGAVGSACLPEDDLGVLTIIKTADDGGYVLASAQGVHHQVLYAHQPDGSGRQACYGSFDMATGASTDPVSETYGLDVTTMPLTETFSTGLMVVQYDPKAGFSRNFKYVSWVDVMNLPD